MTDWPGRNRAFLLAEIQRVSAALDKRECAPTSWTGPGEPALLALREALRLTAFEADVLTLCAGVLLDPTLSTKVGSRPTFAFALGALPNAHVDATSPTRPLRFYRLVVPLASQSILDAPLSLDDRILHFLLGISATDDRLLPHCLPSLRSTPITTTQVRLADKIAGWLARAESRSILQVFGSHALTRAAVLQAAARSVGMNLLRLRGSSLNVSAAELDSLQRACERETLLNRVLPVIELAVFDSAEATRAARAFAESSGGIVAISALEPVPLSQGSSAVFEIPRATVAERCTVWHAALGPTATDAPGVDRLAHQFRLDPADIADIVRAADPSGEESLLDQLWQLCLERSRPRIEDLARRIEPTATWDDLVLPADVLAPLREAVVHLQHRHAVHEEWGFARGDSRGQAITALFSGPSGTGKTLAAEVIARETGLDLYHVDLSQVVDKYVGETEKRLRRIFDAAEAGGAILLFDEADALFGKRAQVERGTDRWANIEVSYLLQRMESYNGLAILTTNAKNALDPAFLRRLRFVVQFPFPDVTLRTELWRRVIPSDAPRATLEPRQLARLQMTGANIKSVAIKAAFHAASEGSPLSMRHLLRAARSEFAKLEIPFPEADVRAWGAD